MDASTHDQSSQASVQQHIGRLADDAVDRLADAIPSLDPVAAALKRVISPIAGDTAPQPLRDAINGIWLGHPLHPVIVALPLGAWSLTTIFDLLGEHRAADLCLMTGLGAASAAAVTGAAQWNDATDEERPRRIGVVHSLLNTAATGIYGGSLLLRVHGHREAGVATAGLGLAVATLSGWLGGHLTYSLGVGVDRAAATSDSVAGAVEPAPEDAVGEANAAAR